MAASILEQTGWRRISPVAVCMDADVLGRVAAFDYDSADAGFMAYFQSRTGYCLPVGSFKAQDAQGGEPRYVRLTRAKMQDCWEVYNGADPRGSAVA